jgi:preprotein translocase subunit SecA
MTGTADTEAEEFAKIYKLDVVVIPTNRTLRRLEEADLVYRTEAEKNEAIVADITEKQQAGRPALVGTVSIEKSEKLSSMLKRRGIKHVVLNAKYHAQEAEIVAQAGRKGNVTIATNMAGRGTDILLGGNPEFMARQQTLAEEVAEKLPKAEARFVDDEHFVYFYHLDNFYRVPRADWERIIKHFRAQTDVEHDEVVGLGGLHIVGTERHEARRIDNQLRGRAGRQGDPGSSRFYLSFEDDLMRIFGSDRMTGLMDRIGMEEGVPIEHGMVTKAIERAQRQVEAQNFAIRKHLLEYDDVMNKQRESVYSLRRELLEGTIQFEEGEAVDTRGYLMNLAEEVFDGLIDTYASRQVEVAEWDVDALKQAVSDMFGLEASDFADIDFAGSSSDELSDALWEKVEARYTQKEALVDNEILRRVERDIMLQIVDAQWKDHLYSLDHLKEGISLRGYGQRDPLVEYKKESFTLFQAMKDRIDQDTVRYLWRLRPVVSEEAPGEAAPRTVRAPAPRREAPITLNDPGARVPALAGAGRTAGAAVAGPPSPRPARTGGDDAAVRTVRREEPKVGRNDPCPCGSGKKYKKCHGA